MNVYIETLSFKRTYSIYNNKEYDSNKTILNHICI